MTKEIVKKQRSLKKGILNLAYKKITFIRKIKTVGQVTASKTRNMLELF